MAEDLDTAISVVGLKTSEDFMVGNNTLGLVRLVEKLRIALVVRLRVP